jgi:hypothetical protein
MSPFWKKSCRNTNANDRPDGGERHGGQLGGTDEFCCRASNNVRELHIHALDQVVQTTYRSWSQSLHYKKQLKIIAVKAERKRETKKNPDNGVSSLPVRTTMDTPHGRSHPLDFTRRGHRNCLSVQRVESSLQETTTTDRRRYTRDVRLSQLLPSQNHVGGSETSRRADTLMLQLPHCRLHLLTSAATAST